MRKYLTTGMLCVAAFIVTYTQLPSANAHIDSASSILDSMIGQRARVGLNTLIAEGYRTDSNQEAPLRVRTLIFTDIGLRTEVGVGSETIVDLVQPGRRYQFKMGTSGTTVTQTPVLDPLFVVYGTRQSDKRARRILAKLSRAGVDTGFVRLARHEGKPTYVIGGKRGDFSTPQIWINKDLKLPVRWITKQGSNITDTRLYGVPSASTGPWFPEKVEVWFNNRLLHSTTYEKITLNAPIDRQWFKAPR